MKSNLLIKKKREKRWNRTQFSIDEERELNSFFVNNKFPTKNDKKLFSLKFNKKERVIQVWFQNKRQRKSSTIIKKEVDNNIILAKKDNISNNFDKSYLSFSKMISIINISLYEKFNIILKILLISYRKEKYPNDVELSSIHYTTNLNYNIIILWYIYKNNFHKTTFKQDLEILSYLYLFPPQNNLDINLFMFIFNSIITLTNPLIAFPEDLTKLPCFVL